MQGMKSRVLIAAALLCLLPNAPSRAVKIKRATRKAAPIYGSNPRVKAAPAPAKGIQFPKPPEPFKPTGVDLVMPPVEGDSPMFRVIDTDGTPAEGEYGQWTAFAANDDKSDESNNSAADPPPAPDAPKPSAPPKGPFAADPNFHETVAVQPGSYNVEFSLPIPADPVHELSGAYTWSQPVRVSKERLTELRAVIPALPASGVAHVRIRKAGLMSPFNQLTLEPVGAKGGSMSCRWDYFSTESIWPDEVRVTLLPGTYRMILTAPSEGAYSSLRYEFPTPVTVGTASEVPIQRPKFNTLKARFTDRKGNPLMGAPVMLRGTGDSSIVTDSGRGEISIRVPVDRYTVRVLVFDDKGSREVPVDRKLDLAADQDRTWKVPVNTIDFGFKAPPAPVADVPTAPEASPMADPAVKKAPGE